MPRDNCPICQRGEFCQYHGAPTPPPDEPVVIAESPPELTDGEDRNEWAQKVIDAIGGETVGYSAIRPQGGRIDAVKGSEVIENKAALKLFEHQYELLKQLSEMNPEEYRRVQDSWLAESKMPKKLVDSEIKASENPCAEITARVTVEQFLTKPERDATAALRFGLLYGSIKQQRLNDNIKTILLSEIYPEIPTRTRGSEFEIKLIQESTAVGKVCKAEGHTYTGIVVDPLTLSQESYIKPSLWQTSIRQTADNIVRYGLCEPLAVYENGVVPVDHLLRLHAWIMLYPDRPWICVTVRNRKRLSMAEAIAMNFKEGECRTHRQNEVRILPPSEEEALKNLREKERLMALVIKEHKRLTEEGK